MSLASLTAVEGYWRPNATSTVFEDCAIGAMNYDGAAKLRCCPVVGNTSICKHEWNPDATSHDGSANLLNLTVGTPDAQCVEGHSGPVCAACKRYSSLEEEKHFVMNSDTGMCEECETGAPSPGIEALLVFLVFFVLFCAAFLFIASTKIVKEDDGASFTDNLANIVVLFVGYAQILSSITETCSSSTSWGKRFSDFSRAFGFVNLDMSGLLPKMSCSLNFSFRTRLYLHYATPLAVIVAVKLAAILAILWTSVKKKQSHARRRAQNALGFRILVTLLILLYPVSPPSSSHPIYPGILCLSPSPSSPLLRTRFE
jgi:hypothetical protein